MPSPAESNIGYPTLTKRQLGAYYTPPLVSQILANWAIKNRNDLILEPGFGGCGFLSAAVNRLRTLGAPHPERALYGCDIDVSAFEHLAREIGISSVGERFLLQDFLNIQRSDFSVKKFDVVMGNPPYVSIENMPSKQKGMVSLFRATQDNALSKRASLWAYFIIHALSFLNIGGRVAWVLPGSFLYTSYGKQVQTILKDGFSNVLAIELNEKIFQQEGTNESAIIVLADGWKVGENTEALRMLQINNVGMLEAAIDAWDTKEYQGEVLGESPVLSMLPCFLRENYNALLEHSCTKEFGAIADVKIGMVTGDSRFFVLSNSAVEKSNLPWSAFRRVLLRGSYVSSIEVNNKDFEAMSENEKRCWLFHPTGKNIAHKNVSNYIDQYDEGKRLANKTFAKRERWYLPDDDLIPDAFLSYMSDLGPRLILNTSKINATNSLHRVYWKASCPRYVKRLVAISLLTTFSQLGAEVEGRHYGSGVLKMEPSSYKKLPIHLPENISVKDINLTFIRIKKLMNADNKKTAMELADNLIFGQERLSFLHQTMLKEALSLTRSTREINGKNRF